MSVPMSGWAIMGDGDESEEHEERDEAFIEIVELGFPLFQPGGEIDDESELGQLRRLEAHAGNLDPAVRVTDVGLETGDEHEDEQEKRRRQKERGLRLIFVIIYAASEEEEKEAGQ